MASLIESETEPFLSQAQRVREEIRARFLSSHQLLNEREAALLSELDQLASYEWEEVRSQIQQLSTSKESIMSLLKENQSHEALELSIAPLNSRIRELQANLETAEARMGGMELEWDEELERKLKKMGGIRIIGKLDYKKKGEPVKAFCRHSLDHGGGRDDNTGSGRNFGGRRDDDSRDCGRGGFGGGRSRDAGDSGGRGGRNFGSRTDDAPGFGDRDRDRRVYRGRGFPGDRGVSGFGRDRDDENGDGGYRGGFISNRGRGSAQNTSGFNGNGGSGFGGNRGFGTGNGGGGNSDDFVVSRSFVDSSSDEKGRGRGGFSGRGGGRGGGRDGDIEDVSGIRDRSDRSDRRDRSVRRDRGSFGGDGPRPEPYIPPTPSDQEGDIFVNVTKGINFNKYENIPVQLTGRDPTQHITSFSQARLSETILENVSKAGYTEPTPVQKYGIPAILSGRDLMGCAQTGSGKTAAFLLPILSIMLSKGLYQGASMDPGTAHPTALIIAPTRELALQIFHEARKFSYTTIIDPVVAYDGTSVGYQLRNLEKGCHILVGTPGRLIDFMTRGKVRLDKVKFLVLDEADLLLGIDFIPDVKKIVHEFDMCQKSDRQTLMFSATYPKKIQRLAADFLNDYLFLTVGKIGGAPDKIVRKIVQVSFGDPINTEYNSSVPPTAGEDESWD